MPPLRLRAKVCIIKKKRALQAALLAMPFLDSKKFLKKHYKIDNPKNISKLPKIERDKILLDLKKTFSPEFLNRIDEIVFFNSLNSEDMIKIVDLELNELKKRLSELKYELNVSKEAKELIITQTEDSQYGARPIKRGIQSMIETPLSDLLLEQSTENGGEIYIDSDKENNQLTFKIKNKDSEI